MLHENRKTLAAGLLAGLALLLPLAGCAGSGKTEGQKRVDRLTDTINDFANSLRKAKTELETTLAEHDAIVDNKDGDLLKHYKAFNKGLDRVEGHRESIRKYGEEMKTQMASFFAAWEASLQQFTNEDLKERSRKRLEQTRERAQKVQSMGEQARAAYEPLMKTLRDHALFLSSDLNTESAASLAKDRGQVEQQADTLYRIIDDLLTGAERYNSAVAMRRDPPAAPPSDE